MEAIGLNFADIFACQGLYSATPKGSFIPGLEFAGLVREVSDGSSFSVGDRVVGLHPGTVETGLSAPFQRNVAPDALFTPATAAGHLIAVIDRLGPADSGGCFDWRGERISP